MALFALVPVYKKEDRFEKSRTVHPPESQAPKKERTENFKVGFTFPIKSRFSFSFHNRDHLYAFSFFVS